MCIYAVMNQNVTVRCMDKLVGCVAGFDKADVLVCVCVGGGGGGRGGGGGGCNFCNFQLVFLFANPFLKETYVQKKKSF